MTDLAGKIAVVTGANSGIGLEACVQLAKRGAEVVMCCRSVTKAETAQKDIIKRSGADASHVHVVQLDLADLDNIESFRSRYDANPSLTGKPVDMLICNAGIMALNKLELTKQGIEAQMGTNVVGHYKFVYVMFDLVKAADHGRVVFVSSGAHRMASKIDLSDFNRSKRYRKWSVYGETKLGDLLLMAKLNRLLEEKGVKNVMAVGCHPGYSNTNLQNDTIFEYFNNLFAQKAAIGAEPTVLAAADPAAKPNGYAGPNGFLEAWGHAKWGCGLSKHVFNQEFQDGLWRKCEELTQCDFGSKL